MLALSRRSLLLGGGGLAAIALLRSGPVVAGPAPADTRPSGAVRDLHLVAAERDARLLGPDGPVTRVWSYGDELLPVVRLRAGERLRARLDNRLSEHTSVHWHGVRVPNDQDGVPYMTQPPVEPGQSFAYDFVPPDTGTFFFHPHCDTLTQLDRGLAGILVVEGDETRPYDADLVLALLDWRLAEDGSWLPLSSPAAAARAGTFGTVRTVNGARAPRLTIPSGGDVRLRIMNLDATRIGEIGIEGAEAALIATDGNPLPPTPFDTWRLGPAMRVDLVIRAPAPGAEVKLLDYFAPEPVTLATLVGAGSPRKTRPFDPAPLKPGGFPRPTLRGAEKLSFAFGSASGGLARLSSEPEDGLSRALIDSLCTAEATHWTINRRAWASRDHAEIPEPLAVLRRGRSYLAELSNETPHPHPIHLHGVSFRVLKSSSRTVPDHFADTVLLTPKERLTIAFVPAIPGDWMLHCHIIEHQETGMMGYFRVLA